MELADYRYRPELFISREVLEKNKPQYHVFVF